MPLRLRPDAEALRLADAGGATSSCASVYEPSGRRGARSTPLNQKTRKLSYHPAFAPRHS